MAVQAPESILARLTCDLARPETKHKPSQELFSKTQAAEMGKEGAREKYRRIRIRRRRRAELRRRYDPEGRKRTRDEGVCAKDPEREIGSRRDDPYRKGASRSVETPTALGIPKKHHVKGARASSPEFLSCGIGECL